MRWLRHRVCIQVLPDGTCACGRLPNEGFSLFLVETSFQTRSRGERISVSSWCDIGRRSDYLLLPQSLWLRSYRRINFSCTGVHLHFLSFDLQFPPLYLFKHSVIDNRFWSIKIASFNCSLRFFFEWQDKICKLIVDLSLRIFLCDAIDIGDM